MGRTAEFTAGLKDYVSGLGADVVGIADLNTVPPYYPPRSAQDVMPGARYAIVYGQKMLWGSIHNRNMRIATAHTMAMYNNFFLLSQQIGAWLESRGYRAAIFNHYLPLEMSQERKGLSGDLSLRHLAVAAGLGVMGRSRLLLTPGFGPRVRFAAVLTDGDLSADAPLDAAWNPCSGCVACVRGCPQAAIGEDGSVNIRACLEGTRKFGLVHFNKYVESLLDQPAEELRGAVKKALRDPFWWELFQELEIGIYYGCFECLTNCPAGEDFRVFRGRAGRPPHPPAAPV